MLKKNNKKFYPHIGPKILEQMVDTVLQFEGDRNYVYRILRALKNRFGSTAELGIYAMQVIVKVSTAISMGIVITGAFTFATTLLSSQSLGVPPPCVSV